MTFSFGSLFGKSAPAKEIYEEYAVMKESTGLTIVYAQRPDGLVTVSAISALAPIIEVSFPSTATDEAHILYMCSCELLSTRAAADQPKEAIRSAVEGLFASYRRS